MKEPMHIHPTLNNKKIDLSVNMLNIAKERLITEKQTFHPNVTVEFEMCDATTRKFQENSFDVIYSRDCILHIYNKLELFKNFQKWLKPGGVLFRTDCCCGKNPHSKKFNEYLNTPNEYTNIIKNSGFINVNNHVSLFVCL